MEIGPVASVRIAPMIQPRLAELGSTDVQEVEHTTQIGDEIYIPSASKAASGFENEEDTYEEIEEEVDAEAKGRPIETRKISRFA